MADITQQDFYKGIFLRQILGTVKGFDFTNLGTQSTGTTPMVSGIALPDFYAQIKTMAEDFAAAMVQA